MAMKESLQPTPARPRWMWLLLVAGTFVILFGLLRGSRHHGPRASEAPTRSEGASLATTFQGADRDAGPARPFTHRLSPEPQPTAQEIVANKVAQFVRSR